MNRRIFQELVMGKSRNIKQKSYLKQYTGTHRFIDSDGDGVINGLDCEWRNPKKHNPQILTQIDNVNYYTQIKLSEIDNSTMSDVEKSERKLQLIRQRNRRVSELSEQLVRS